MGCLQVFGQQSPVEQLIMDLEFSWNGDQKFQLMVGLTPRACSLFEHSSVLGGASSCVGPDCGCGDREMAWSHTGTGLAPTHQHHECYDVW